MSPEEAPTLRSDPPVSTGDSSPRVHLDVATLDDTGHAVRYRIGDTLGVGGMGEVRRCRDRRIGREIAMKVVRPEAAGVAWMRERFLREARIQGQLEHPCIVPVYDLGLGADGATYFTMKRVRGVTLEAVIEALRSGDPEAERKYSRRRLLAAFSTVCGAVDYAHSRGVVHRDLKPGNIMLGDFGEVYVLDWGVARVLDLPDDLAEGSERVAAPMPAGGRTAAGAIVGTPGYMAPEQLTAEPDLDARADVYALGAILFEVLSLDALHLGATVDALIASTLAGPAVLPSARANGREVPPELDALCGSTTTRPREDRLQSAGALRDAIERYLDGDRDLERRHAMASELADEADRSATRAHDGDDDARAVALRQVGRALALDPNHSGALRTFVRLLVEPPRKTPAAVEERLLEEEQTMFVTGAQGGVRAYVMWLLFVPGALWLGVHEWSSLAISTALTTACAITSWVYTRKKSFTAGAQYALLILGTMAIATSARLFGPFMLLPAAILSTTLAFSLTPHRGRRRVFAMIGAAGLVVPALLDASGLVAPSYEFVNGTIVVHPRMTNLPAIPTFLALVAVHLATLLTSVRLFGRIRDAFEVASRRLNTLAWQLQQIVPAEGAVPNTTRGVQVAPDVCRITI